MGTAREPIRERSSADEAEAELAAGTEDPGKLSRLATGIPIVPAFDGYRTFAVLGIVILHTLQNAGVFWSPADGGIERLLWAADLGQSCLDMLFITSGFVLFLPSAMRNGHFGSIRAFLIVRSARLFPAYWGVLVLMLILIATVGVEPEIPFPHLDEILLTFTTLEVPAEFFRFDYLLGFGINRAIWTLSLEVTFYVILPLIALRFFRRPVVGALVAAAIAVSWRLFFNNFETVVNWLGFFPDPAKAEQYLLTSEIQLPYWALSFAMGMLGARVFAQLHARRDEPKVRRWAITAQAGSLGFLLCAFVFTAVIEPAFPRHSPPVGVAYTTGLATFMFATALAPPRFQAIFSNKYSRSLADSSYGIYLVHMVVISYAARLIVPPADGNLRSALIWLALVVPVSTLIGYLSAEYFERPIRRRAHRWAKTFQAAEDDPAAGRRGR